MDILTVILIALFCLVSEGFFAGSEIALVSVNRIRLKHEAESGSRVAKIIDVLLSSPEKLFVTSSLGINLSVVIGTSVVTGFLIDRYGNRGDFYATLIMSPLSILLAEIIPKSVFQHRADFFARLSIYPLKVVMLILYPFVSVTSYITNFIMFYFTGKREFKGHFVTREEIKYLIKAAEKKILDAEEKKIIGKIFDFKNITVEECMIPLINIVALDENSTMEMARMRVEHTNYSRIPIFRDKIHNIHGILNASDILRASDDAAIRNLMKPAYYVPKGKKINELLEELQWLGIQMAVVVDEYGGTIGIVTREDILEEIVGEIEDEYDTGEKLFEKYPDGAYFINARMEIDAINEQMSFGIPKGDYETLGGFLLNQFQKVPKAGDTLEYGSLIFKILDSDERSIKKVEVRKKTESKE